MIDFVVVGFFVLLAVGALAADGAHRQDADDLKPAMPWAFFFPLLLLAVAWVFLYWTGRL